MVAGGVESMSRAPFVMPKAVGAWARTAEMHDTTIGWRFVNPRMQRLTAPTRCRETAENVAERHGVSREDQDAFALRSQQRAAKAIGRRPAGAGDRAGPGPAAARASRSGRGRRAPAETSLEALAGLRPFSPGGTVTAGNASGRQRRCGGGAGGLGSARWRATA